MSYFAVYVPPSKAVFEGRASQCAGSIAAVSLKSLEATKSGTGPASGLGLGLGLASAVPAEDSDYPPDSPLWLIFTEKIHALNVLRHFKDGRLREFPNQEQAESYVQYGFESIESLKRFSKPKTPSSKSISIGYRSSSNSTDNNSYSTFSPTGSHSGIPIGGISANSFASMGGSLHLSSSPTSSSPGGSGIITNGRQQELSGSSSNSSSSGGERPQFRAPGKQELQEFRRQIERGNLERVKQIVWDNPRFLISSGDTPTWLTEGYRYNALHICAQENQAKIAELLLKTISDRDFTQLYAGKKASSHMFFSALNDSLLDYYLNMPDSARGETPLHLAARHGHANVVEVLVAYPQCKSLKNIDGLQPKDLICQRPTEEANSKLDVLMCDPHYVPVLRSVANELPPQVGKPFSPKQPPNLQPNNECGIISAQLSISALAGPMSRDKAINFYKRWKTPTRVKSPIFSPSRRPTAQIPNRSANGNGRGATSARRLPFNSASCSSSSNSNSSSNGNLSESNNNDIAKMADTSPLRDEENMVLDISLMTLLRVRSEYTDSYRERDIKNSDIEKGLEVVGRQLASQELIEWREYWDFLDAFVDIRTPEGLDRLEAHLVEKSEQTKKDDAMINFAQLYQSLDLVAIEQQQQPHLDRSLANTAEVMPTFTEFQTPYTCVEKSLQVFAKRITKTLIINFKEVTINDMLLGELKRLKTLVASFKIDARFTHVDFSKVHSRITHLVASYVFDSQEVNVAMRLLLLQKLRKLLNLLDPDDRGREQHLGCWCRSLLQKLEQTPTGSTAIHQLPDTVNTEEVYINAWEAELSCLCQWVVPHNLSRKSSRRKRTESLRAAVAAAAAAASASEEHDKTLYYDCLETLTACEDGTSSEEENFRTPPESMTPQWSYQLYIYGKEPTKRDVDVLNAIINVDLDEETRPHVYAWRVNMESFPAAELELFPSPKSVLKTIKPDHFWWSGGKSKLSMPPKPIVAIMATPKVGSFDGIVKAGRLASPNLSIQPPAAAASASSASSASAATAASFIGNSLSPVLSFKSLAAAAAAAQTFPTAHTFQTPLNKMRGLFSKYREVRSTSELDSSSGSGR